MCVCVCKLALALNKPQALISNSTKESKPTPTKRIRTLFLSNVYETKILISSSFYIQ